MTKQCKALELCDELLRAHRSLAEVQIDYDIEHIRDAITDMQDQHEAALAKTVGTWVKCEDEMPLDNDDHLIQFEDGTEGMGCIYHDHNCEFWGSIHGIFEEFSEVNVVRWFKPATPPPPTPIVQPEPEIDVLPLRICSIGVNAASEAAVNETYQQCNEAHKAAMRPVLKELAELRAALNRA